MACGGFFVGLYALVREVRKTYWATGGPAGGHSSHEDSNEGRSRGPWGFDLTMLYVPLYTNDRKPHPSTLYPTSVTIKYPQDLPSIKALRLVGVPLRALWLAEIFLCREGRFAVVVETRSG